MTLFRAALVLLALSRVAAAEDARTLYRLGLEAKERGDLAAAAQRFEACAALYGGDARCLYSLAIVHKKRQRWTEAETAAHAAVTAAPGWGPPLLLLGQLSVRAGALEDATARFDGALSGRDLTDDERAECWNGLGVVRRRREEWAAARAAYDQAIALAPQNGLYRTNAGILLLRAGSAAAAEAHLKVAVTVSPQSFEAWDALGTAYVSLARADDAIEALSKATELNGRSASTWFELAGAHASKGSLAKALDAFQRYRDLAAGDTDRGVAAARTRQLARALVARHLVAARLLLDPVDDAPRAAIEKAEAELRENLAPSTPSARPADRAARLAEAGRLLRASAALLADDPSPEARRCEGLVLAAAGTLGRGR